MFRCSGVFGGSGHGKRFLWFGCPLGQVQKTLSQPYPLFSPEQNNTLYIVYLINKKRKKLGFMRHLSLSLLFWQHPKDQNTPRQNAGFQPISVPVCPSPPEQKTHSIPLTNMSNYSIIIVSRGNNPSKQFPLAASTID